MKTTVLRQYLKDIRGVGAVAPSSKYLAKKMLADIDFTKAKLILEYGPGTGVLTKEIVKRKRSDAIVISIEFNAKFHGDLVAKIVKDDTINIVHGSAEEVRAIMKQHGVQGEVDLVVSGLPFASLPKQMSENIMTETKKVLKKNGAFVTFQYTPFKKAFLLNYFDKLVITKEFRNIPPAYVFLLSDK